MTPPTLDAPNVVEFIGANHRVFLFCRDGARRPIGYAMRSVAYRSATRCLYFATYAKSAKVQHLRSAPEVACLIGDDQGWISVGGLAHVYQPSAAEVDELIGKGRRINACPTRSWRRSATAFSAASGASLV